jgi:hypothetical protein
MTGFNTYRTGENLYGNDERSEAYGAVSGYAVAVYPVEDTPAVAHFMERDAGSLADFLAPVEISAYAPISEQIFGEQSRQSKISLEHILNLMNERARIHKRHMDDIEERHRQLHGQLFGAQLHSKEDNHKREMGLQTTLMRLDTERRKEELTFWKDSSDLRESLFELAKEYQAARHRTALLGDVESGGEPYGG